MSGGLLNYVQLHLQCKERLCAHTFGAIIGHRWSVLLTSSVIGNLLLVCDSIVVSLLILPLEGGIVSHMHGHLLY